MANKVLALLMVVAVAGVALGSLWLSAPGHADASGHSATRSFSSSSVAPGEEITVTILADNYGGFGNIVETLPSGFTSPDATGQTVNLILFGGGPQTKTYTVTASDNPGSYPFSGTLADDDFESNQDKRAIGGSLIVTVNAPPPTPDTVPSATRSLSATPVDPGGTVTVTIQADNYGGLGRIVETLPSGFTSPEADGQTVTLRLLSAGPQTETYTVTASDNPGSYTFSGVLESEDKSETTVGGPSTVTVNAPAGPSARRSFSTTSVAPGGTVTVTIRADNYGGLGRIVETLPSGFTSPDATGQTVTLRLLSAGPQTETYTVTASDNSGPYTFSGVLEIEDKSETTVGGSSSVTVRVVAPAPERQVNRAPVFSAGNSTTRSVDENSASGANVGARVTARDPDGDSLTYTLAGTDASSFNVAARGQIQVRDGTNLDYEGEKNTYVVEVTATDPSGASDMITVTVNVTNVGEVTLWASATEALTMAPQVGDTITGAVMDPEGGVTGESWQWARTTTPAMMDSWMDIAGETNAAYTVTEGDTGYYLRVMATYTDAVGTDTAMEYSMPTMMVGAEAGDPLFGYDTSGNGRIDKAELAKAVFDYEINRTLEKPALADLVFSYEIGL